MKAVLLGSMFLLWAASSHAATGAALFEERCTACHSIGGGDLAGPDLVAAKRLARNDLRAAVKRMETNVGPMTAAEIDSLVGFLVGAAPHVAVAATPPPPRGNPSNGRRLFFGEKPLANGGAPCFACHSLGGEGGNLAADLTNAKANIVAVAEQPAFPLMKAAYAHHAVTEAEANDLAAFVAETKAAARKGFGIVHGGGLGLALIGFGVVAVTVKRRGARARLLGRKP